jgi:hypothetical protein
VYLRREQHREAIEQYVEGYRKYPETEEELGWVEAQPLSQSWQRIPGTMKAIIYDVEVADYL